VTGQSIFGGETHDHLSRYFHLTQGEMVALAIGYKAALAGIF